jgi:site-specific recombinase XerD
MALTSIQTIEPDDIDRGCQKWLVDTSWHRRCKVGPGSVWSFTSVALKWFRFLKVLNEPIEESQPIDLILDDFEGTLRARGMTANSIRCHHSRLSHLLTWIFSHHQNLASVRLSDVEEYLQLKRNEGWTVTTMAGNCYSVRTFFRYAEMRGWNRSKLWRNLRSPRVERYSTKHVGPAWSDVRRLLDSDFGEKPSNLRAAAILSLCAIYGFRASEITKLTLDDFDWINETVVVRRAKNGRVQQFPLQFEVGDAILRYLRAGRPICACRRLFVTIKPPYRPVRSATLYTIVSPRLRACGIDSESFGAHSLRHSCATHLVREGSSLREIADFLGHRGITSVCVYAKSDVEALQEVSNISLRGAR